MFVWQAKLTSATKIVLNVLELNEWMTQEELVKEAYLPLRTVKYTKS